MGSATAAGAHARAHLHVTAGDGTVVPASSLDADLRDRLRGEVRFDRGSRALYATDGSNYRQVPIGVVIPRDTNDVLETLAACRRHGAPVFARGGGTSLAGQCCNAAVAIDMSKYLDQVIAIDPHRRQARVQPGLKLDRLRAAAAAHHLTFGPDPATHQYCTLGGMIGNNSCGVHSVMADFYGPGPTTAHNVDELDVVTYRGVRMRVGLLDTMDGGSDAQARIVRDVRAFTDRYAALIRREFPDIPRRVSGYNLPALLPERGGNLARALVGSESTLVIVLEATARLIPQMPARALVVLGYPDIYSAAEHVPDIMSHRPVGLEGLDDMLVADLNRLGKHRPGLELLPEGKGWLFVEFGAGTAEEAREQAERLAARLRRGAGAPAVRLVTDLEEQGQLWEVRESGLAATAHVSGQNPTWPGWEDSAVPPERLAEYLRDLRALFKKHDYHADLYGHFGQGCVHCRIDFDLVSTPGLRKFRAFLEEAADLVHRYGGSLSGEHGDGQARGELLSRMFSPEMLQAFREFKEIWDPDRKLNPGKIVDPYPLDSNLRFGPGFDPPQPETWFRFPQDRGSFAHATMRCVGVGKCRKEDAGTMCPSYQVTGEEQHSTRGRARLLFEMLRGDPLRDGWNDRHVHEALDLCLACKGCKGECPVQVDMATYKAEFLSHYYQRHWRPRSAYAFGWIHAWARLAALAPGAANWFSQAPGVSRFVKALAGVAGSRRVPAFAPRTFREGFLARPAPPEGPAGRVILWPDTFNDHFHPGTLHAAVRVLEAAGFTVAIPRAPLCCGRPLYDYGMLGAARGRLVEIMAMLADDIRRGVPIVGLEPSCVSVFRDELGNLFPNDPQAERLRTQTFAFSEFLMTHQERLPAMTLDRRAVVHGHCHHKALIGMEHEQKLLARTGLDVEMPDDGCCGMAGAFGFEADHYDVSMALGERRLLPAVRQAADDTLIVADGFSCREQIAQGSERRALHLAEVMDLALREGPDGPLGDRPERRYRDNEEAVGPSWMDVMAAAFVAVAAAGVAWGMRRKEHGTRRRAARNARSVAEVRPAAS